MRTVWKAGAPVANGWLAIPNSFSAETMAHQGWDSLTIDLQHGMVDYQAMVTLLQAISTTATVPVVRVPWLERMSRRRAALQNLRRLPGAPHRVKLSKFDKMWL